MGPCIDGLWRLHVVVRIAEHRLSRARCLHVADDDGRPAIQLVKMGIEPIPLHLTEYEVRAFLQADFLGGDTGLPDHFLQVGHCLVGVGIDPVEDVLHRVVGGHVISPWS